MIYLIVIVGILLGACLLRLLWIHIEIRHINEQLDFIIKNDTNISLVSSNSSKEMCKMIQNIDRIIEKYKELEIAAHNKEKSVKNDFTNLSHDIRTPLTAISGYFQLLCDTNDPEERKLYMNIVNRRIDSLKTILESIFMYSKLQNDNYQIEMYQFDLNQLITDVTLGFYQRIQESKMQLHINYCEDSIFVFGTEDAYSRIIQNIISNAIEHGEKTIALDLRIEDEWIYFNCVNDVNKEDYIDMEKVFERFYKADSNRTHSSSGLGLSIAKMLSDKMGAELVAKRRTEEKFEIELKIPYIYAKV